MSSNKSPSGKPFSATDPMHQSAHEIWLAGLGAFTKAQQEGSKMFDSLVQEGLAMQRRAQATAEEKIAEAGQKMSRMAEEISQQATGQWDKLEGLFEERVARALQRLGIPSAHEVQALHARVADLEKQLHARTGRSTAPQASAKTASPVKKAAPAKKAAARKVSRQG